jgi:hypothetical protein
MEKRAYKREDIGSFVCYIIDVFAVLRSFSVSRDNIIGYAFEFFECKGDYAL